LLSLEASPTLYVFGGLPASGKSTLSKHLARIVGAVYLRADTIEQTLRDAGMSLAGPEGYLVAYAVARDNLALGLSVVSDSVNPIAITRETWRQVAVDCGAQLVEVEVVCSDSEEHRRRVESRQSDVPGLALPSWPQVRDREYEAWPGEPIAIDTAGDSVEASCRELEQRLGLPHEG